jgi:hypothetical protein
MYGWPSLAITIHQMPLAIALLCYPAAARRKLLELASYRPTVGLV